MYLARDRIALHRGEPQKARESSLIERVLRLEVSGLNIAYAEVSVSAECVCRQTINFLSLDCHSDCERKENRDRSSGSNDNGLTAI